MSGVAYGIPPGTQWLRNARTGQDQQPIPIGIGPMSPAHQQALAPYASMFQPTALDVPQKGSFQFGIDMADPRMISGEESDQMFTLRASTPDSDQWNVVTHGGIGELVLKLQELRKKLGQ